MKKKLAAIIAALTTILALTAVTAFAEEVTDSSLQMNLKASKRKPDAIAFHAG